MPRTAQHVSEGDIHSLRALLLNTVWRKSFTINSHAYDKYSRYQVLLSGTLIG